MFRGSGLSRVKFKRQLENPIPEREEAGHSEHNGRAGDHPQDISVGGWVPGAGQVGLPRPDIRSSNDKRDTRIQDLIQSSSPTTDLQQATRFLVSPSGMSEWQPYPGPTIFPRRARHRSASQFRRIPGPQRPRSRPGGNDDRNLRPRGKENPTPERVPLADPPNAGRRRAADAQARHRWPKSVAAMADPGFVSAMTFHAPNGSGINTFHRPHPDATVVPVLLRSFGRRMAAWFGWAPERFGVG
ncbi:hypothetical protein VTK26DRAFT_1220 [Humicola hyalothermophila]